MGFIAKYLGVLLVMPGVNGGTSMSTSAKGSYQLTLDVPETLSPEPELVGHRDAKLSI